MRRLAFCVLCLIVFPFAASYAQTAEPSCPPSAPDGYRKHTACTVTIDRSNPASPNAIVVKAGTRVTIRVTNTRANETLVFTPTTTQTPPVDVAATFLKSAITPLQSLVINSKAFLNARSIDLAAMKMPADPIATRLNTLTGNLDDVLGLIADASVQLSCLQGYRVVTGAAKSYTCSVAQHTSATFEIAKTAAITSMLTAAKAALPSASLQDIKTQIDADVAATLALPAGDVKTAALAQDDVYLSTYAVLEAAIGDARKAQTTLLETSTQLSVLANAPPEVSYAVTQGKDYKSSVAITAQEVLSKASNTIGTVVVTWQSNPWEVSTGIMFSRLISRSFENGPLIIDGQPQLDAAGKTLTEVQQLDTTPTVMFPLVMASYRIGALSNFGWENRCPGHCAILLTAGVGLNLNAKTAEFAVGPSFKFGSVLFTPGFHIGRIAELAEEVTVGARLGSSPPSPLPTSKSWTAKFGLAVSYVLPFQ